MRPGSPEIVWIVIISEPIMTASCCSIGGGTVLGSFPARLHRYVSFVPGSQRSCELRGVCRSLEAKNSFNDISIRCYDTDLFNNPLRKTIASAKEPRSLAKPV